MKDLSGLTAMVTGAAGGIGRAFAVALAREGVGQQALIDIDKCGLEETAGLLAGIGCGSRTFEVDVTEVDAVREAVESAIGGFGGIDLLVNVAGVGIMGAVEDLGREDWKRLLDIDLQGTINTVAAAYPHMLARRAGHIVNVASSSGLFVPVLYLAPYVTAKFAVVGFSESLMLEAAVHGVGVTCVCPGNVKTGIHSRTPLRGFDEGARGLVEKSLLIAQRPEATARSMIRAVKRGRFLVVTTPYARLAYFVRRHFPWLYFACMRRFAPKYAEFFDDCRTRA